MNIPDDLADSRHLLGLGAVPAGSPGRQGARSRCAGGGLFAAQAYSGPNLEWLAAGADLPLRNGQVPLTCIYQTMRAWRHVPKLLGTEIIDKTGYPRTRGRS